MVLIACLDGRLLTSFSLCLGSIVEVTHTLSFVIVSQILFHVARDFIVSEQCRTVQRIRVESSNLFDER